MSPLTKVVAATPTAQMRRVAIPKHRRQKQVLQTVTGGLVAVGGMVLVFLLDLGEAWSVAAVLLGLRIASREFLLDCLKIVREVVGLLPGGGRSASPEPDSRHDDERGA